jgi:catechol 2,3-dioxygenase-like lactoylglutathione lyase family enzyme
MAIQFEKTIPLLRIFDLQKAKEFYVDFLGFAVDWEHRFDDRAPIYMSVSRGTLTLHLTEHYGDCCPGSTVYVSMRGIDEFHREIMTKKYGFMRPGIGGTEWGSTMMEITDPFGNRIRFDEPKERG